MHAASVEGELEGRPRESDFPRHSSPDPVALFESPLVTSFCPFLVLALQDICVSHQGSTSRVLVLHPVAGVGGGGL